MRTGKSLGIVKTARARITDEEKRKRIVEKVSDEDKTLCPEAFEKLSSGEIDIKEFRLARKAQIKSQKDAERAAKKASSGKATKAAKSTKTVDPDIQKKVAAAKAEIEAKTGKTSPDVAVEKTADES
jgi:hypothetical protein